MHRNVDCTINWVQLGHIRKESKDPAVFSIIKVFDAVGMEEALKRNSLTQRIFLTLCSSVVLQTEEGSDSINTRNMMAEDNPREKLMAWMCLDNLDP